jgi:hypothetical protein
MDARDFTMELANLLLASCTIFYRLVDPMWMWYGLLLAATTWVIRVKCEDQSCEGLFGRAPAPAPRAAPAGALPNSGNYTGSGCGAGAVAPRGFQRGGGATFWWLHLAPTRNPLEELFCQTFFKTTQLHQRSHSTRGARAGAVFGGAGALPNRAWIVNEW